MPLNKFASTVNVKSHYLANCSKSVFLPIFVNVEIIFHKKKAKDAM